jgi:hypothetical protein
MQFKLQVIASILFFVAQTMATPTFNSPGPDKRTNFENDGCTLPSKFMICVNGKTNNHTVFVDTAGFPHCLFADVSFVAHATGTPNS